MTNTSAAPTNFGWDFQVNAGIVLLIDHMDHIASIILEGETEDIEITLTDGMKIYAQAKSVVKFDDYRNVSNNCKKALSTLAKANLMPDHKELIYITNSPNPLSNQHHMGQFYGAPTVSYENLDTKNKAFIDNLLSQLEIDNFDRDAFSIRILPFHTNDTTQRYLHVHDRLKQYLGNVHDQLTIHTNSILSVWQQELFKNGTKDNLKINVTKRELHLPILVAELNRSSISEIEEVLELGLDTPDLEEITSRYSDLINNHVDNYEFLVKVITSYNEYYKDHRKDYGKECISRFINNKWKYFSLQFEIEDFSPFLQEALTKIVVYKIISNKIRIGKILEGGA